MGVRREGREAAVQFLFQLDLNRGEPGELDRDFWILRPAESPRAARFARGLVGGVLAHREEIDARIQAAATNYQLRRIAAVDRNILRVALFEMLHCPDVPPAVSINEAIEIAKAFGSEDSGRFVNGILDRLRAEIARGAGPADASAAPAAPPPSPASPNP
jgi:N utilization substance protein B